MREFGFVKITDVLVKQDVYVKIDSIVGVAQTGKYTTITLSHSVVYQADAAEALRTNVLTVDMDATVFLKKLADYAGKRSQQESVSRGDAYVKPLAREVALRTGSDFSAYEDMSDEELRKRLNGELGRSGWVPGGHNDFSPTDEERKATDLVLAGAYKEINREIADITDDWAETVPVDRHDRSHIRSESQLARELEADLWHGAEGLSLKGLSVLLKRMGFDGAQKTVEVAKHVLDERVKRREALKAMGVGPEHFEPGGANIDKKIGEPLRRAVQSFVDATDKERKRVRGIVEEQRTGAIRSSVRPDVRKQIGELGSRKSKKD